MVAALWIAIGAVVVAVAVIGWLNLHRHGEATQALAGWQRTEELFRDPSTGRVMRVWVDPADGSRHYVPDQRG